MLHSRQQESQSPRKRRVRQFLIMSHASVKHSKGSLKSIQIENQPQEIKYSDVFGSVEQQRKAVKAFKAVMRKRELLLKRSD